MSKQIVAIVKPFLADRVISAVAELPIHELMVREVKGFGRQKNYLSNYEENEYSIAYLPKVELTVWVDERYVEQVVECIQHNSRTGRMGDGKIFVLPTIDPASAGANRPATPESVQQKSK